MDNKDSSRNRPSSRSPCELLNRVLEAFQGAESPKTNPLRELLFRVVVGDHPILIRAEQAEVSDTRLAEVLKLSPVQLRALQNHPDGSCHGLDRENVKNFCDYYKISPANIVPLMDNPFLSLPSEITAEILHRLGGNPNLEEEKAAIACEKRRYARFETHPLFVDVSRWFSQLEKRSDFAEIFNRLGEDHGRAGDFENLAPLGLELLLEDIVYEERTEDLNQKNSRRRATDSSANLREATFNLFGAEHEGYVSHDFLQRIERSISELFSGRENLETTTSRVSCQVSGYFLSHEFRQADAIWSRFGWKPPADQDFRERVKEYLEARVEFREWRQREEEAPKDSHADKRAEQHRLESWIEQITAPSGVCVRRLVANHALITQFEQKNMQARNKIVIPAATHHFNG
jgi:hypothetical protein